MKISVAGTGYVGMSIATLLAQHNEVTAVDVVPEKVDLINQRKSPIQDEYIERYLAEKDLNLTATLDGAAAYRDADFVVIAAPTNYDPQKNFFDTSHVVVGQPRSGDGHQEHHPRRLFQKPVCEICRQGSEAVQPLVLA